MNWKILAVSTVACFAGCAASPPAGSPSMTLTDALVSFQRDTGSVIHFSPDDVEGLEVTSTGDDEKWDEARIREELARHDFRLARIGEDETGFWSVQAESEITESRQESGS